MVVAREAARLRGAPFAGARVVVHGSGNVGGVAARLLHNEGCRVVAMSDVRGGIYSPRGLNPAAVGHVTAHGLSTVDGDRIEAQAIRDTLGNVPVTAPPSVVRDVKPLRIATRVSPLALAQARYVAGLLGVPTELVTFSTRGDRAPGPLDKLGGKGLFTAELEAALRKGQVQFPMTKADFVHVLAHRLDVFAIDPRLRGQIVQLLGRLPRPACIR
jgi:hypothetical protein